MYREQWRNKMDYGISSIMDPSKRNPPILQCCHPLNLQYSAPCLCGWLGFPLMKATQISDGCIFPAASKPWSCLPGWFQLTAAGFSSGGLLSTRLLLESLLGLFDLLASCLVPFWAASFPPCKCHRGSLKPIHCASEDFPPILSIIKT